MGLRVNAAGNREAQEVHRTGLLDAVLVALAEHQRTDFDRADAAFEIELGSEGDAGKLRGRNVRKEGAGVDINRVAAGRLNNGDAFGGNVVAEIGRGGDAVIEIVLFESFVEADGDGVKVASGEAAVSGE